MAPKRKLKPLPIFDPDVLESFLVERKHKAKHAANIWKYLLATPKAAISNIENVPGLPKALVEPIKSTFALFTTKVVRATTSTDETTKLLVELQDGMRVETVIIKQGCSTARRPDGEPKTTICVSSQVGCKMGCNFCATGSMGELGSLYAGEILEQLIHARRWACIRNVVFMGMGEPFNNYKNVLRAVRGMLDPKRFGLSGKRVTVSTVGVTQKSIERFTNDLPNVSLAISLHAPNQKLRETLTSAARGLPLPKLMAAVDNHLEKTGKKVMMEYVMLKGFNDSIATAHELGVLLKGKNVAINLIPYNNTLVKMDYEPTSGEGISAFKEILTKMYGLYTNIRTEKGGDVAAACGQLVVQTERTLKELQKKREMLEKAARKNGAPESNGPAVVGDIEDFANKFAQGSSKAPEGTEIIMEGNKADLVRMQGLPLYSKGLSLWPVDPNRGASEVSGITDDIMKEEARHQLQSWVRFYGVVGFGLVSLWYMCYRTGWLLGLTGEWFL
jgi:23S rRNA (adenine(2503)-C(2))-methyltransferase